MTRKTKKKKEFCYEKQRKKIPHNRKWTKRNACVCMFGGSK